MKYPGVFEGLCLIFQDSFNFQSIYNSSFNTFVTAICVFNSMLQKRVHCSCSGVELGQLNQLNTTNMYIVLISVQGVSKKTPLKEMCDFLTLKMLPLALALIETKNRHLFDPWDKNCPF